MCGTLGSKEKDIVDIAQHLPALSVYGDTNSFWAATRVPVGLLKLLAIAREYDDNTMLK